MFNIEVLLEIFRFTKSQMIMTFRIQTSTLPVASFVLKFISGRGLENKSQTGLAFKILFQILFALLENIPF